MRVLLFLSLIALLGCDIERTERTPDVASSDINNLFESISDFEHEGHKYLYFSTYGTEGGRGGVVHHPDCSCLDKEEAASPSSALDRYGRRN